jgi:hypothetical protein
MKGIQMMEKEKRRKPRKIEQHRGSGTGIKRKRSWRGKNEKKKKC